LRNQGLTSDRDKVFEAADIVEVASAYTPLTQRAGKFLGLCPFHAEKTPSFTVDRAKKLYHCFGCHRGGDVFRLVMEMERFTFPEALRHLASRYRIPLSPSRTDRVAQSERKRLIEINAKALAFYRKMLMSPEGNAAREFLKKRGVKAETAAELSLGYAPPQWDRLFAHLRREGIEAEHIAKAGLALERQTGSTGYYDRFRDRVMFPIFSESGEAIAFGGRLLRKADESAGMPKFINSPETAVYTKGRELYGLHLTREPVRKAAEVLIVEGYMDFLLLYQEGVKNCVACLGTSLTRHQVKVLNRHGARGILNFDPDPAGRAAIIRSLELFFEEDAGVRVLVLPGDMDPDEFVLKEGLNAYVGLIGAAPAGEIFALDRLFSSYADHSPDERMRDVADFLQLIRHMSNAVRQDLALREAAARFRIGVEQLRSELSRLPDPRAAEPSRAAPGAVRGRARHAERRLLLYCLGDARGCRDVAAEVAGLRGLLHQPLFRKLAAMASHPDSYDQRRVFSNLDAEEASLLSGILIDVEEAGWPSREEALSCLQALRDDAGEAVALQSLVEQAEADPERLEEVLRRKQESVLRLHDREN